MISKIVVSPIREMTGFKSSAVCAKDVSHKKKCDIKVCPPSVRWNMLKTVDHHLPQLNELPERSLREARCVFHSALRAAR